MNYINNNRNNKLKKLSKNVPTPFLLIDELVLVDNIKRINSYAETHGISVRYHFKTHKSLKIAKMQIKSGAKGISVAKVHEAKAIVPIGLKDITISNPIADSLIANEVAKLSTEQFIRVAVDSEYSLRQLHKAASTYDTTIGILIIFDAGIHRCGISEKDKIIHLAESIELYDTLQFQGIQMYLGHLYGESALHDNCAYQEIQNIWVPVYNSLCNKGITPLIVSSGSSTCLGNIHRISYITEIIVGTALFNEYFLVIYGHCSLDNCAAKVISTVISNAINGQVIIDAGSKALSAKQLFINNKSIMGYILEYPQAKIMRLNEEHGWLNVQQCRLAPKLGERISIIPINISLCVNLYEYFYIINHKGEILKEKVVSRGYDL